MKEWPEDGEPSIVDAAEISTSSEVSPDSQESGEPRHVIEDGTFVPLPSPVAPVDSNLRKGMWALVVFVGASFLVLVGFVLGWLVQPDEQGREVVVAPNSALSIFDI